MPILIEIFCYTTATEGDAFDYQFAENWVKILNGIVTWVPQDNSTTKNPQPDSSPLMIS